MVSVAVLACGGDSDPIGTTTPDPGPLAPFVGSWNGVTVVHTLKADTTQTFDLIANGGTLTLQILPERRYVATVTFAGETTAESGRIRLDGLELVLSPESPQPEPDVRVQYVLSGNQMTWIGDSRFDFNFDDQPEETVLHVDFVRVGG